MKTQIKCPLCRARLADKGNKKCTISTRCEEKEKFNLEIKCYKCKNKIYIEID
ncbi:hypothetical protein [Gemelliphila palaticanis]|uniref:Uncharacterized protein n=1 Tax=Gemelliphila palaticanis TaxID=81950 RepID=A0ABX2SYK7_9BACL|nr:hypothetical protein [Gemella palaticanis]MBF0714976.1 hypothetical protein [Gemella palaticanis]NYS46906.1 hypothetical protein [Gemella palaticanis]